MRECRLAIGFILMAGMLTLGCGDDPASAGATVGGEGGEGSTLEDIAEEAESDGTAAAADTVTGTKDETDGEATGDAAEGEGDTTESTEDTAVEADCTTDEDCGDFAESLCKLAACVEGKCVVEDVNCDDGDDCTEDGCNPDTGCTHAPIASPNCAGGCSDTSPCESGQVCLNETCVPLKTLGDPCDVSAECESEFCDAAGYCGKGPVACSGDEECDDSNPCTANACGQEGLCGEAIVVENGTPCGEGNACYNGACVSCINDGNCDDGNDCTVNACKTGVCENTPNVAGALCGEGTGYCNGAGQCDSGVTECTDDGDCGGESENLCVLSKCNEGVCVTAPVENGTDCADGKKCAGGFCVECINNGQCDDGNSCTANLCDQGTCAFPSKPEGAPCDNGAGMCDAGGICVAVVAADCAADEDCADGNACTKDICADGKCSNPQVLDQTPCGGFKNKCVEGVCQECSFNFQCNDNKACTTDTCNNGVCEYGDAEAGVVCDQGAGVCDGAGTCIAKLPAGVPCDKADDCASGICGAINPLLPLKICKCDDDVQCPVACNLDSGACVECLDDGDCEADETCSENKCAAKLPVGVPCGFDSQCASGSCGGQLIKQCQCTADSQCENVCDEASGKCVECTGSGDCGAGEYCSDSNTCEAKLSVGLPCSVAGDCASGICEASSPISPVKICKCSKDADCSQTCDTNSGLCTGCVNDSDCASNEYCSGGNECQVKLQVGTPCSTDASCSTGACEGTLFKTCACTKDTHCIPNLCDESTGKCEECVVDGDCGAGEYCTANQECADKLDVGVPCTSNADCGSGSCAGATPLSVVKTCQCTTDLHCIPNVCDESSGSCEECTADFHCGSNEFCSNNFECIPLLEVGMACSANNDCKTNICGTTNPLLTVKVCKCDSDSDCSGVCSSTGLCEGCATNADCTSSQFCGSDDECVNKLPKGTPCQGNAQCQSGNCSALLGSFIKTCQ